MSDLHSATVRPGQLTRRRGSATRGDFIPEGFRHPLPSSTRGLAAFGVRPVEDLEVGLLCLISDVPFLKMCIVSVLFCVTTLTTHRVFTTTDGALDRFKLTTEHHDSKD